MSRKYSVYVVELRPEVLTKKGFHKQNPGYRAGKPCVYVGSTSRTPDERFDQHKSGYKHNRFARDFGERLRPDLFERYNPIPSRREAEELEEYLAERLRSEGWGVWQG